MPSWMQEEVMAAIAVSICVCLARRAESLYTTLVKDKAFLAVANPS
jgi:hypothetical protein